MSAVVITSKMKAVNVCHCNDNHSHEDGSAANTGNVAYIKYTSDSGQYPA